MSLGCCAVLHGAGCFHGGPDPEYVTGNWRSSDVIDGKQNLLIIDEDELTGHSTLHFYYGDDTELHSANFTVVAIIIEPNSDYVVEMICDSGPECEGLDFTMTCETPDPFFLDCVGSDLWEDYGVFQFRRVVETAS